jgi:protein-disulfide isomerase
MNANQILPALVLLILLISGGYLLFQNVTPIKTPANISVNLNNVENLTGFNPPLGNPNAPVKIIEFSDFQCPFCRKLYFESFKKIKEEYIDKELVVFYHRDFAFLGPESLQASLASKCAREQNKFWEYVDILFKNQAGENVGSFSKENLIKFAEELNLDKEKFEKCLNEGKYMMNEIQQDLQAAQKLGVRGTPYLIINNDIVEGAYPYDYIKAIIEKYIKK